MPPRPRSISSRSAETLLACLGLAALAALFLATPLVRLGSGIYSTADLGGTFALLEVEPGHAPANRLLSDPPFQMQPWLSFARAELAQGRLPLWNPHNACGQPLVANYQSGLFSPFNLPYLLFGPAAGLLLGAFLKVFALGLFTWLFLRELRLSAPAAFFGAAAFAFSGHNLLCLAYPHPGAVAALPAGLFFAERFLARRLGETAEAAGGGAALLGLGLSLGLGALAGQPEPFFFAALTVGAWCALRLASGWRAARARPGGLAVLLRAALALAAAAVLGTGLAAVQILPFLEYLQHGSALKTRLHELQPFHPGYFPLFLFPDLLGSPVGAYGPSLRLPEPNYEGANMSYPGGLVLLLALAAPLLAPRLRATRFFAALAALWYVWSHDLFGAARLLGDLPLFSVAPINRSQPLWLFALACCSALALEALLGTRVRSPRRALGLVAGAAALLVAARLGADRLLEALGPELQRSEAFASAIPAHLLRMSLLFGLGAAAAAAIALVAPGRARAAAAGLVLLASFGLTGWHLRDYNPTIERRFFLPRTPALEELARIAGDRTVATLGEPVLPAEANAALGVSLLSNYDAVAVEAFDRFAAVTMATAGPLRDPHKAGRNALVAAGVEWVLARGAWPRYETALTEALCRPANRFRARELVAGAELTQVFTPERDGLDALMTVLSAGPASAGAEVEIALEELPGGRVLASRTVTGTELLAGRLAALPRGLTLEDAKTLRPGLLVLRFDAEAASRGRSYRAVVRARAGEAGAALCAWLLPIGPESPGLRSGTPGAASPLGALALDAKTLPGALLLDWSHGLSDLEPAAEIAGFRLLRFAAGPGRYYRVGGAEPASGFAEALRRLLDPGFDARRAVILDPADGPIEGPAAGASPAQPAEILLEEPGLVRLRLGAGEAGWLVAARTRYPGWEARVDGELRPLRSANHAFQAVFVEAGAHEVELRYRPRSFRLGIAVSLASLAGLAILGWVARRPA